MAIVEITTTQEWTCPLGVTSAKIECYGAGGGGSPTESGSGTGGGGGGAYAILNSTRLIPNKIYYVTVGTGGTPGSAGTYSDFNAEDFIFCYAEGGLGSFDSKGATGGTSAGSTGDITVSGGDGGGGDIDRGGGGGGGESGGYDGTGTGGRDVDLTRGGTGGEGGNTDGGNGGTGGDDSRSGTSGGAPGGGGGGAGGRAEAGHGADGLVRITYTVNVTRSPAGASYGGGMYF